MLLVSIKKLGTIVALAAGVGLVAVALPRMLSGQTVALTANTSGCQKYDNGGQKYENNGRNSRNQNNQNNSDQNNSNSWNNSNQDNQDNSNNCRNGNDNCRNNSRNQSNSDQNNSNSWNNSNQDNSNNCRNGNDNCRNNSRNQSNSDQNNSNSWNNSDQNNSDQNNSNSWNNSNQDNRNSWNSSNSQRYEKNRCQYTAVAGSKFLHKTFPGTSTDLTRAERKALNACERQRTWTTRDRSGRSSELRSKQSDCREYGWISVNLETNTVTQGKWG